MTLTGWVRRILEGISDEIRRDLADELATAIELHFGLIVTASSSFADVVLAAGATECRSSTPA